MKKIVTVIAIILCSISVKAQFGFDIARDSVANKTMFIGRCTFDDLTDEPSFDWLTLGSNNYNPDPLVTDKLKQTLPSCEIIIFMGTWCEDTQNLLPKLYKTMMLSRSYTNYKMYALDRNKKSKNKEQEEFKVSLVPTIVVRKNGVEIGRIVEAPKTTIEADLLKITEAKKG